MRTLIRLCAVLLASLPTVSTARAAQLDPADYDSRSGEYALHVESSEPHGGEGAYTLTRNGTQVWSGQLPYTMSDAVVADDGSFMGFGRITRPFEAGELIVGQVSAAGEVLRNFSIPQKHLYFHSPPYPKAEHILLHPEAERFVVLVDQDASAEVWWSFDLGSREDPEVFDPHERFGLESGPSSLAASAVPGTPLSLVHWYLHDHPVLSSRFALYDEQWNEVWRLELPGDYTDLERDALHALWREGGILSTGPHAFELRLAREGVRLKLRADEDPVEPGGWIVTEVGRKPYEASPPRISTPEAVAIELEFLGSVQLGAVQSKRDVVIRDIQGFGIERGGDISFIRWEQEAKAYSCVRLDSKGELLSEQPAALPTDDEAYLMSWTWLGAGTWLGTMTTMPDDEFVVWLFDTASGQVTELHDFPSPSSMRNAIAADGNGGFAIATRQRIERFAPDGSRVWVWNGEGADLEGYLSGFADVAITSRGEVVAFDKLGERVFLLSREGAYQRTIELKEGLPQELNYPTDVIPDRDGGFLLVDFKGEPPVWRLALDGTVRGSMSLSSPDATLADGMEDELLLAPNDRLWTTDGNALFRIDEEGAVDRIVGVPPSAERIDVPSTAIVDSLGRILVLDRRSRAVHVFDRAGQRLAVCQPEADDFVYPEDHVAVATDGSIFLRGGLEGFEQGVVEFGPDGERRGIVEFGDGRFLFQPGTTSRWQWIDLTSLERIQADGSRGPKIDHLPDGRWLGQITDFVVAANGEVAVVDVLGRFSRGKRLSTYDTQGAGQSSILLPAEVNSWAVARNDDWIAFAAGDRAAHLVRVRDLALFRVEVRGEEGSAAYPGFSPDGREVWWIDGTRLDRYALPQE